MTEMMVYNLRDVAAQLGVMEAGVADLVRAGKLELSPGGFVTAQALSNYLVDQRIERDREAQQTRLDMQDAHYSRVARQARVMQEVVRAAMPKLLVEAAKRLMEPLVPEVKKGAEDIALDEAERHALSRRR